VAINIKIFLVGIIGLAGLALILSFSSSQTGNTDWASNFMLFALVIVVLFFVFGILSKRH
jgi:hypothetical protein